MGRPILSARWHSALATFFESGAVLFGAFATFVTAFVALVWTGQISRLERGGALWLAVAVITLLSTVGAIGSFAVAVYASRRIASRCGSCKSRAYRIKSRPPTYRCRACGKTAAVGGAPTVDPVLDPVRDRLDAAVASLVDRSHKRDVAIKAGAQEGTLTMPPPEGDEGSVSIAQASGRVTIADKKTP